MKRRGSTLIEMLLGCTLLGLFFTGTYATLVLARQFYAGAQQQRDALDSAVTAVHRLGRALSAGAGASFVYQTDPPACMFLSGEPPGRVFEVDATGALLWQKWVCFYLDVQRRELRMSEVSIVPTATLPDPPEFAAMLATPGLPVARDVQAFNVTQSFPSSVFVFQVTAGSSYQVMAEGHHGTRQ